MRYLFACMLLFAGALYGADDLGQLQQQRREEQRLLDGATKDAERYMTRDWVAYRQAILKKEYLEKRIKELDAEILEKQKQLQ